MFDSNIFRDEAEQARGEYRQTSQSIEASTDYTIDAKQRMIAEAREATERKLADIRVREDRAREDRINQLRRRLVGRPDLDTSNEISWRDAADRVATIETEQQAITLLNQALENSDGPLIRTILRAGYDRTWAGVINTYTAAKSYDYDDAEELWSLVTHNAQNGDDIKAKLFRDLAYAL